MTAESQKPEKFKKQCNPVKGLIRHATDVYKSSIHWKIAIQEALLLLLFLGEIIRSPYPSNPRSLLKTEYKRGDLMCVHTTKRPRRMRFRRSRGSLWVQTQYLSLRVPPPPPSTVPSSDRLINGELRPEGAWRLSGASVRAERHQTAFDLIARPAGALCSLCSVSVCYLQSRDLCAGPEHGPEFGSRAMLPSVTASVMDGHLSGLMCCVCAVLLWPSPVTTAVTDAVTTAAVTDAVTGTVTDAPPPVAAVTNHAVTAAPTAAVTSTAVSSTADTTGVTTRSTSAREAAAERSGGSAETPPDEINANWDQVLDVLLGLVGESVNATISHQWTALAERLDGLDSEVQSGSRQVSDTSDGVRRLLSGQTRLDTVLHELQQASDRPVQDTDGTRGASADSDPAPGESNSATRESNSATRESDPAAG